MPSGTRFISDMSEYMSFIMRATSGSMSGVALLTPRGAWSAMRVMQSRRLSSRHAWMYTIQSRCTSRCRRRVAHDQSCVRCSRSTCHILTSRSTGAVVALIALLVSRPTCLLSHCCTTFQSTDRQCLGQWAETHINMLRHVGVGVEFLVGLRPRALDGDSALLSQI